MTDNHRIVLLCITILFLLTVISAGQEYRLSGDTTHAIRPLKYHILNDPDRHADRMKQYHDNVAQLRLWRRYLEDFNGDGFQEFLRRNQ